ncbi:MAG TPA: Sip1-related alpha-galactosidase [Candidatus Kryptonia bacterium]
MRPSTVRPLRLIACFVVTLGFVVSLWHSVEALPTSGGSKSKIQLEATGNKFDVYYAGKVRLVGGNFMFESKDISTRVLTLTRSKFTFRTSGKDVGITSTSAGDVVSFFLSPGGNQSDSGEDFVGMFFDSIPGYARGVSLWRYGPWNSWTKPVKIDSVSGLESSDVQFFYWQYSDGLYGAAIPLSGQGYRTTLGEENGMFGSKSVSYFSGMNRGKIPQMAVGFGNDPYKLFAELYKQGLKAIGKSNDLVSGKVYPEVLKGIGWCSWNASVYGTRLNENLLVSSAADFKHAGLPMRWILIDDGWFDNTDGKVNSFRPDSTKFPDEFKPVIQKLKNEYGIKDVGIWHAFDGYWSGINPDSRLGKEFKKDLFSWKEKTRPDIDSSAIKNCYFVSPFSKSVWKFYNQFHKYLSDQGFTFVKVDNQLITERMSPGNFPIFDGAEIYHEALNLSVARYFGNSIINCMDMTPEAYLNFGSTSVARAEDDYWPEYDTLHPTNYWMSRAGEHVIQEVYNSLYFSQMVYPDYDMFESTNPAAAEYAVAHALSNGPTYITDKVGRHNFGVLWPLIFSDGTLLRANRSLLPTEDCLFQVNGPKLFKAYSMDGQAGLIGIWNCADSNGIDGEFKPSDVHGIEGDSFAVYGYFERSLRNSGREERLPVSLPSYGCKLYYVVPEKYGNAVIGLVDKYNAPAAIVSQRVTPSGISVTLYNGGRFAAAVKSRPRSVTINGIHSGFSYENGLLIVNIPVTPERARVNVEIKL